MKIYLVFILLLITGPAFSQNTPWPSSNSSSNVGLGNINPISLLDISGDLTLRNNQNVSGAGAKLHFTSLNSNYPGPSIRSHLDLTGVNTHSRLVLSSYSNGNKDELVLTNGNIGVGTFNPVSRLDVSGDITIRNINNLPNAGGKLHFTSLNGDNPGPSIRSSLDQAGMHNYSRLVLSSYFDGNMNEMTLANGQVGIGTMTPDAKLTVNGKIHANEIKVDLNVPGPDYVFDQNYNIKTLAEVEQYVKIYKHLPEIPSATDMAAHGIDLGTMNMKLLLKIEELTLYMIERDNMDRKKNKLFEMQQARIDLMEQQLIRLLSINKLNN